MKSDPEAMTVAPDGRPMTEQPAWRRDFPVDWPEDHYVARREFTRFLALISLSFVVGQGWILALNFWRKRKGLSPLVKVAATTEVPVGATVKFFYPDDSEPCLLTRLKDGSLVAFNQKCTHLSCNVVPDAEKGVFECPCHEARFDLATGRPLAGPPRRPLARIRVEERGGAIYAAGVELRVN